MLGVHAVLEAWAKQEKDYAALQGLGQVENLLYQRIPMEEELYSHKMPPFMIAVFCTRIPSSDEEKKFMFTMYLWTRLCSPGRLI